MGFEHFTGIIALSISEVVAYIKKQATIARNELPFNDGGVGALEAKESTFRYLGGLYKLKIWTKDEQREDHSLSLFLLQFGSGKSVRRTPTLMRQ